MFEDIGHGDAALYKVSEIMQTVIGSILLGRPGSAETVFEIGHLFAGNDHFRENQERVHPA
jgi:hypothetical protein